MCESALISLVSDLGCKKVEEKFQTSLSNGKVVEVKKDGKDIGMKAHSHYHLRLGLLVSDSDSVLCCDVLCRCDLGVA